MKTPILWICAALSLQAQAPLATLVEHGHFKRARALAEQRYRATPNDPDVLWALSSVRQQFGALDEAIDFAEKLVALQPGQSRAHVRLADALGQKAESASLFQQLRLAPRFKKELNLAATLDPRNPEALELQILFYREAPGLFGGDKNKAREIADRLMGIDAVRGYLAQLTLLSGNQPGEREGLLRNAAAAGPANYEALMALGNFLDGAHRPAEAEPLAREARRIAPDREPANSLLAATLVQQQKWTDLDAALTQAERDASDDFMPFLRAGWECWRSSTELPRAERYFHNYLSQEPEPRKPSLAAAHYLAGLVMKKQGRGSEAGAEFRLALQLDPKSPAKEELKRAGH